ncbi:MAG: carboxypeptidase-like regulatory domain-containing protein [Thermofilaceae archaeon]
MKGETYRSKVLALALGTLIALTALTLLAPPAQAAPGEYKAIHMILKDWDGKPFANERVRVAVWNSTTSTKYPGGYPLAYFDGTTDENGRIQLTLTGITPIPDMDPGYSGTSYNITIAIQKYGRWFLLNQRTDLGFSVLLNFFFNKTVLADHWWSFRFYAEDYLYGSGLYSESFYGGEFASFKVFLGGTLLTEIWADENGVAKELFNISDTEVTFKIPRTGWILISGKSNVTLTKEVYWNLLKNRDDIVPVKVGKDLLIIGRTEGDTAFYNMTDLIDGSSTGLVTLFNYPTDLTNYAYTRMLGITIVDPCGGDLTLGDPTFWAVTVQADLDGKKVILRSAKPDYYGGTELFYVPDISSVYGRNVTIIVTFYNVPVFTLSLNITALEDIEYDFDPYVDGSEVTTDDGIISITAPVSVVPVRIMVFDLQPNPQPLAGARIIIEAAIADPIYTATAYNGYVQMPPFDIIGIADTSNGGGEAYWGLVLRPVYGEYGYLPVPYEYRRSTDLVFEYRVRVFWRLPGGMKWVEVTDPENSTISLNFAELLEAGEQCEIQDFGIYAKVFEAKVKLQDLCGRDISPSAFPGAMAVVFLDDTEIGGVTPGPDGTVTLKYVPGGNLKVRLTWKGILMRANVTQPEPVIAVEKNVAIAPTLVFPIGDLNLTLTMWDVNYPIEGLNVTLQYFKDGKLAFKEKWARTDCNGLVTFERVPLMPLEPARYEVRAIAYTHETPYTRDVDGNLLVANSTISWSLLAKGGVPVCKNELTLPTWIYSFTLMAADHLGNVLRSLRTSAGTYPVAVLLNDGSYEERPSCCECDLPLAWVTVDFRIFNKTTTAAPDAVFKYISQQYYESDPEAEEWGFKPHMFIAGAKYWFAVFHGGVLVYNYTITLPRPDETTTETVNESGIVHPIFEFTGAPSHLAGGGRAQAALKLITWVQHIKVTTMSNAATYAVPRLNLTLVRTDALNWTLAGDYDTLTAGLTDPTAWEDLWTGYAWSAVGDDKGVISIQIPVWQPTLSDPWLNKIKFGSEITRVYVLAGKKWNSPGVPDTPKSTDLTITNASEIDLTYGIYGYIVNWNHTAGKVTFDPEEFFKPWNITTWCGVDKTVRTLAMDGFCVDVLAPPPCPGGEKTGLANQLVWVDVVGATDAIIEKYASGVTDATGRVTFKAPPVITYKFCVEGAEDFPRIEYTVKTKQNFEELLKPYGLTEETAGLCPEIQSVTVCFTEDHNAGKECVELTWEAVYLTIEDWSGRPLKNMMVAASKMYPEVAGGISTLAFSGDGGVTRLLVSTESAYSVKVFWRDSYLLFKAGKIPAFIDIYDSIADEWPKMLFAHQVMEVTGFTVSPGATIKTFVYVGQLQLLTKDGKQLSPEALSKLTVTITWPDMVKTKHKPESDGSVPILLNKNTVTSWPFDASKAYSPESAFPQSPPGSYNVVVEWEGVGKIGEKTFRIQRAKMDTPEFREVVTIDVADVTFTLRTPFGTPMAGASVTAARLDGTTLKLTADSEGKVTVPEAPLSVATVTVENWNGQPINFKAERAAAGALTVNTIGRLVVTVVGARGQGLEGARVKISGAGAAVVGTTDSAGKFAAELPSGSYTVEAEKGGRTASTTASVTGGQTAEATLRVDVFMTVAGWEMSFAEFAGLLLLIAVLVIVLFILAHEYAVWRRRRIAKAIVPAKAEGA